MLEKKDIKGIIWFLSLTFVLTYTLEFSLIAYGVSPVVKGLGQYMVALAMWIPALAAFLTVKFIVPENTSALKIRVGNLKPYIYSALIFPACYLFIYGVSWLMGFGEPDWDMKFFKQAFADSGTAIPDIPRSAWLGVFFTTLFIAPFINGLFGFGEELGWRGYLLFKLLPLGKWKAYTILAIIWAFWHLPMVVSGFMYPGYPVLGMIFFCMLTFALGLYMNELTIKNNSSVLAGWLHGLFNSQRLGIWTLLFPQMHPLLGGYGGVVGIVIWLLLGFYFSKKYASQNSILN